MFTHTINNPNHFLIEDDYFAIPFGHRCSSALACKYANIRKFSLPFDWTAPSFPKKIQNVLENNFEDFIPDVYNGIFHNKYDISLVHFNSNLDSGIEEYKRRIERFNDIIHKKKIYFVYINEDYLYNEDYRQDEFNDTIFNEMLRLEELLKTKKINYTILYFNFKQHEIPKESNIINIVLHSTTFYDVDIKQDELREYCGKILSELFNTIFISGHSESTFNN